MSRNDTKPPNGWWAMWVAVFGWVAPMGVYYTLHWIFRNDPVWVQVGPYLLVAFSVLTIFSEICALFMAAIAWPAKITFWTVGIALILIGWNTTLLFHGLRQAH